ncbi:hypothetical protein RND71_038310 [Anisodus tanguticus]|uniref:V-type proton ATPase subunit a n=1 Tax=Anisodus tanguticus TaxID=243964 RepID=A0AAE1QYS8_9SOLA|nr:hypothetical protein RND71_038310 [Anisodus tanguticus]
MLILEEQFVTASVLFSKGFCFLSAFHLGFMMLNLEKSPFQRTYATQIKRGGEMARKLRFLKEQMTKAGFTPSTRTTMCSNINLDQLEVKLGELEGELAEMILILKSFNVLTMSFSSISLFCRRLVNFSIQLKTVLQLTRKNWRSIYMERDQLIETFADPSKQVKLGFVSGLVAREKSMAFERFLFRATRGNVFLKQVVVENPVTDPLSGSEVEKNVFVIFFSGERAKNKILKFCNAFGANKYPFTDDIGRQHEMITEVSGKLLELKTTVDAGQLHRANLLQTIGYEFDQWNLLVKQEKFIYHTLNMLSFDVTKKCLVVEGWCPVYATSQIQNTLHRATLDSNSQIGAIFQVLHTTELPPTYFRTNKFTSAFQEIVDAYGIAKYQEVNPGVFTIVTFPFLFAVISETGDMVYACFLQHYTSSYGRRSSLVRDATTIGLIKVRDAYPFGVDPKWHGTRSELPFLNSLKMKMSNLLGVAQMNLGIILSYFNAKFFQNDVNVWHRGQLYAMLDSADDSFELETHDHSHGQEEFEFSEIFVHLLIHTIELVLGAVSNTASYLRLLAHSELSSVFYDKVLLLAMGFNNIVILIIGIVVFIFATVGVLLVMETLSVFLHAWRLHWVEFQNKFYEGDGYKFSPSSFGLISEDDD